MRNKRIRNETSYQTVFIYSAKCEHVNMNVLLYVTRYSFIGKFAHANA